MNHSLIRADRTTHLKIVSVALVAAVALVTAATLARVTKGETIALVTGGKPAMFTAYATTMIR